MAMRSNKPNGVSVPLKLHKVQRTPLLRAGFCIVFLVKSAMIVGTEWLIEAAGCDKDALRDENAVKAVLSSVIADLGLKSVGSVWHKFDGEGGVTGLVALTESHLACHTYPEHQIATFNLYCCRTRPEWDWDGSLKSAFGAAHVSVMKIERGTSQSQISDLKFEIAGGCQ